MVVDPAGSAQAYGDEPLLLAREATTVCCPDRPRGADLLVRNGVGTIIMDDGFQNPSLAKDLSFLVVDARAGLGNGLVFPAGPLRMRLLPQIARASALIVVGTAEPGAHLVRVAERRGLPIMRARLIPDPQAVEALRERPLLAFAGIGRPEKFFDTLRAQGLEIAARQAFADHHEYSAADAHNLLQRARELGATLVTTQKDAVRFSGAADGALGELRAAAMTLPVHAEFDIVSLRNLELLLDTVPALARSKP